MDFFVFKLRPLALKLIELLLVLFPNQSLLLKQSELELWCFLDWLTTNQHLRRHSLDFQFKAHFLFLFFGELFGPLFKLRHRSLLVFFKSFFLSLDVK